VGGGKSKPKIRGSSDHKPCRYAPFFEFGVLLTGNVETLFEPKFTSPPFSDRVSGRSWPKTTTILSDG
ncbi:hypothetical protein KKI24_24765, partial [bacterium]|nr:hypothetical protein [bacterium]